MNLSPVRSIWIVLSLLTLARLVGADDKTD